VELCLSSNVKTCSVPSYESHHFSQLYESGCPVVLCTDDTGLFRTKLSDEYLLAARSFGLDRRALMDLVLVSYDYTFCNPEERRYLKSTALQVLARLP